MIVAVYSLFMRRLEVETRIGIHAFERAGPQRLTISIEIEIAPGLLPASDDIGHALDYDWIREQVRALAASRHFDLQETLARAILDKLSERAEIVRAVVETAKPDVYPDVAEVGCRLVASRPQRGDDLVRQP